MPRIAATARIAAASRARKPASPSVAKICGHGLARLTRDDVVEIDERQADAARQQAADGRLAGTHEPDEKDRRGVEKRAARGLLFGHALHYGAKAVERFTELEMRGVMKTRNSVRSSFSVRLRKKNPMNGRSANNGTLR